MRGKHDDDPTYRRKLDSYTSQFLAATINVHNLHESINLLLVFYIQHNNLPNLLAKIYHCFLFPSMED